MFMQSDNGLRIQRIRVLNEISFLYSQRVCGGPQNEDALAKLRADLREIDAQLAALSGQTGAEVRGDEVKRSNVPVLLADSGAMAEAQDDQEAATQAELKSSRVSYRLARRR
jgi:hypothetical protein